ncbi:hypothetical protein ACIPL1_18525 [Pseudomonas sp. NPDC090202]|uniref:hypothetical protein n=1 Tax=unclassified Pseudomonas TaxID=196821 RepID=UPI003813C557
MNSTRIVITGPSAHPLPLLGHGLWVDHLADVASTEALVRQLGGAHLDMLVDLRRPNSFERLLEALALSQQAQVDAWLLVIVSDEAPEKQLRELSRVLADSPTRPKGILVTPAAYLLSYQPDAVWPDGPTPEDVAVLARDILPGYEIGGGVPTYFTELNRCRPAPDSFDYLTHATSPIVHAADDLSVMESLESLGDIVRSARQLACGKPYRLTTSAIGAWCNPYGGQLTPNPERQRLTLSDRDPRQRGLFAAAWTLGHYAAVQRAGVDAIALWAVNEPFAVAAAGEYWPVFHVLRGLNQGRGKAAMDVDVSSSAISALCWREGRQVKVWLANLTGHEQVAELEGLNIIGCARLAADTVEVAHDDPGFMARLDTSAPAVTSLQPYEVLVLDCRWSVERGL